MSIKLASRAKLYENKPIDVCRTNYFAGRYDNQAMRDGPSFT
jgi:hypothetical protein